MVSLPYGKGAPGSLGSTGKCVAYGDRRTAAARQPDPTAHLSGLSDRYGFEPLVGHQRLESGLQERHGGHQPRLQPRAGDQLPHAGARLRLRHLTGRCAVRESHEPRRFARRRSRDAHATGRPTVPDVIIFMTDGQANQPSTMSAVQVLQRQGDDREGRGSGDLHDRLRHRHHEVLGPVRYPSSTRPGRRTWRSRRRQTTIDDLPGGCGPNENKDGDHYFCTPAAADLEPVFRQVAEAAIGGAHLVD